MNSSTRKNVLWLGFALTVLCTFSVWFSVHGMPMNSPSEIPQEYWSDLHRHVVYARMVVGIPLLIGLYIWFYFAWRLVRTMDRNDALTAAASKTNE